MSEDFIFALVLLAFGLVIVAVGAYLTYRQKVYFNPADNSIITEIDIPILGKLKTNVPAIALCFLGLVPVVFGYYQMKNRSPNLLTFQGDIAIDSASVSGIDEITVGVTSNLWSDFSTPDSTAPNVKHVTIQVPDSWPSYIAYAYALGKPNTHPARVGTSREDPTFKLRIGP